MFNLFSYSSPSRTTSRLESIISTVTQCVSAAMPVVDSAIELHSRNHRRTDSELSLDTSGTDKSANEFQRYEQIPLQVAINLAQSTPGVYVLRLDGRVMKCGRASYSGGVAWRLRQYYNLNYDARAQNGDHWSVTKENRDNVTVSWQCCPASKCNELEYKLFQKYGKGEWAQRAPVSCPTDSWALLI